jgi:hypothetical protein
MPGERARKRRSTHRLQGDGDLVVAPEQAMLDLLLDLEADHAAGVVDGLIVEIDPDRARLGDPAAMLARQNDRKEPVLGRIRIEDVRERGGDHGLKAVVGERPDGVLARRPGAEVRPRDQDRVRLELDLAVAQPVVEQELAEARPLDPLQELLRDDLIGIDVGAIKHRDPALDDLDGIHASPPLPMPVCCQSRMSTKRPSIAAAAAIRGLTRWVRPPLP